MKTMLAFVKKEFLEVVRTGKIVFIVLLFVLFGIMNPAIAKLTPWAMKLMSEAMAENGVVVAEVQVTAMTSWAQFFRNGPLALIVFALIFSDCFTKEYKSGTLLLVLTKGLSRYKVVIAKTVLLLSLWTLGYGLSGVVTYGVNAVFWDNGIVDNLFASVVLWWLFGVWIICLMVLFSSLLKNTIQVILCTGATALAAYLLSMIPRVKRCSPAMLLNAGSLLTGAEYIGAFIAAIVIAAVLCIACVAVSIPIINKKQI